jgi:hypothetical protein
MYQSCIDLPLPTIRKTNILAASEVPRHDGHYAVTVSKESRSQRARIGVNSETGGMSDSK